MAIAAPYRGDGLRVMGSRSAGPVAHSYAHPQRVETSAAASCAIKTETPSWNAGVLASRRRFGDVAPMLGPSLTPARSNRSKNRLLSSVQLSAPCGTPHTGGTFDGDVKGMTS